MRSLMPLFAFALVASGPALATEIVPVAPFRNVELRGGGDVALVPGSAQRVAILEGSTQFTRFRTERGGKLVIDACNDRCPREYHLRIRIESPNVPSVGVQGGGTIQAASGFPGQDHIAAGVTGGGKVDFGAVEATNVAAGVNGGGVIVVRARSTLAAGVSGGGEVRYFGNPLVTSGVQGGGRVRPVH